MDRTELSYRRTDCVVKARTGSWPLSVSADKLGIVAMRCAVLQERFAIEAWSGERQPRDGSGRLIESYPAAMLKILGLPFRSYKGDSPGVSSPASWCSVRSHSEIGAARWPSWDESRR